MLTQIQTWLSDHPFFTGAVVIPLVTAPINWLCKPRNPAEYAALPPRVAAFLKLIGGFGFDGRKVTEATLQLVTGRARSVADESTSAGDLDVEKVRGIAVNANDFYVKEEFISYEAVCALAGIQGSPTVTFECPNGASGTLAANAFVFVVEGMIFHVAKT